MNVAPLESLEPYLCLSPCFRPGMRYSTLSRALHDPAMQVFCVDWSPDGSGIASGGKDHVIKLWRH